MRLGPVLALLLGLAALPAASACSLAQPAPFVRLAWEDADSLITNRAFDVGRFDLGPGAFSRLAATPHRTERNGALSPDGRWLVYSHSEGLGADCSSTWEATYALELAKNAKTKLRDEALRILATSAGPVLSDREGTGFERYAWGDWGQATVLARPWESEVQALGIPGSTLVAAWERGRDLLHVVDASAGRLVGSLPVEDAVAGPAVSPDGRFLALATSDPAATPARHELLVYELSDGTLAAKARWSAAKPLRDASEPRSLTWGPRGLVVPVSGALWWIERPLEGRPVQSIPGDSDLKSPLWAVDGDRLAVGQAQSLRLLDLRHRTETRFTSEGDGFVKSTPSFRPSALPLDTYREESPPPDPVTPFAPEGRATLAGLDPLALLVVALVVPLTRSRSR